MVSMMAVQVTFAAASGTVKGRVVDKGTKSALPGAIVQIMGTGLGAATDLDGKFTLHNVPVGDQTLNVSYVGYAKTSVSIAVADNMTLEREIGLVAEAVKGDTVTVLGQARGQMSAINQQLSSNSIINVVSADKMKELPDANIAESIGRLPGISLQRNAGEAYGVVVRGLSPKYNEVTIEGVPMSSTNYYDRGVDLSLVSDDLVRSVEVSKTLQPDMDANALGGTINLTLKSAQPGLHYDVMGQGSYNNLRDTYKNYKFAGSVSDRFLDDQVGALLQGSIEEKQLPSDQFKGDYESPAYGTQAGAFYVLTQDAVLTESSVKRHRYSASLILDFASDLVDVKLFNVYDQKRDSSVSRTYQSKFGTNSIDYNIYVNETKTEQRTHSIQALFKLGGTELPVSLSYTRGDQKTPGGMEFDFEQTGLPPLTNSVRTYALPSQLMAIQGVMDPYGPNSNLTNMLINNTRLTDESVDAKLDWKVPFRLSDTYSGTLSAGGKYHNVNRTSSNSQVLDYLLYGNGAPQRRDLVAQIPYLNYLIGTTDPHQPGIPSARFADSSYSRTSILGYPIGPGLNVGRLVDMQNYYYYTLKNQFRYWVSGLNSYNQTYTDKENSSAGYIMGELNVGSDLTIVPGVRYQDELTDISAYQIITASGNQSGLSGQAPKLVDSKRNTPNWYPSVNIKYRATENIQVIGAAYKSVSLPSYGEINPLIVYSPGQSVTTNNPLLRPSTAWNFDLGTSLSSNSIGLVTVNLFYKEISNLIYGMANYYPFFPYLVTGAPADMWDRLPGPTSGYFDTTWAKQNNSTTLTANIPMNDPAKAFLRGIEISWQTHLWYLPGVLSGVVLDLNASYMSSRQLYPSFALTQVGGTKFKPIYNLVYTTVAGPLQNQPKATYNAILGWDYMGFSSRFSLRYQQQTLTSMDTQFGLENSYYDNVLLFDIALKQQIIGNLSVFANATNLNNHIDNYYFSHPAYTTHPVGQLPTSEQTYGWAAQLGISYSY
jgi:TonB-dependent receptor